MKVRASHVIEENPKRAVSEVADQSEQWSGVWMWEPFMSMVVSSVAVLAAGGTLHGT